jgi:HK97 gp10 family phage protein
MSVKGLDKVLKKLSSMSKEIVNEVDEIMEGASQNIEEDAKVLAPVYSGGLYVGGSLRQGIKAYKKGDLKYSVEAKEKYSAYIEFGTGGKVNVPTEMEDIAIQFKGEGVKQVNIQPQPFLYPSFVKNRTILIKDLKDLLKNKKL